MKTLKLSVVQFTPAFGEKMENLSRMKKLVQGLCADIVVFPELCTTGYFFTSRAEVAEIAEERTGPSCRFFKELSRELNAVVVAGFAERHRDKQFNSAIIAVPEEKEPFVYRKTHLFYKEQICFDAGDTGFFVVKDPARKVTIGPMICYDWRFPESARILTLMGADIIVSPSNLITETWMQVMPVRAIENKIYLAVANRAGAEKKEGETLQFRGHSTIYDYNGNEIKKAGPSMDEILSVQIFPEKTRNKSFNPINDFINDRQPQHYQILSEKGRRQPV